MSTRAGSRWRYVWIFLAALLLIASFYFDAAVQSWMLTHQTAGAKAFMQFVSRWGDWPSHIIAGLIGGGIAYAAKSRAWLAIFAAMLLACASAGVVNRIIKISAGRSRPAVEVDAGWKSFRFSSNYNAFPSGHTAASSGFFAALFFARRRIALALLAIPLLIAASRLYLNAHHLSDVVCAAILGVLCGWMAWRFVAARTGRAADEAQNGSA
ncbi:MAG: phosphatase PAP2 family protein [Chthoniobacterales bacterium]